MEFRRLSTGEARQATWSERDYIERLREAGVEDVYVEVEQADDAFWETLLLATHWHLLGESASERYWDTWEAEFRWAHGLPPSRFAYKHYCYKQVLTSGMYGAETTARPMSPGQRLSAVEHLLDVVAGDAGSEPEEFARVVNERAAFMRVGVSLEGRRFVRVSSEHLHEEVTRPALLLLATPEYERVDGLYRKAFGRALANDHAGAITAATSSVEEMLRVCLDEPGGRLQSLLQKARQEGWLIPAVEQLAVKLDALRTESDAHTAGTDEPHVSMLAVHVAAAVLVHLAAARSAAS